MSHWTSLSIGLLVICVMGCGRPQPSLVRVEGIVTLDGAALGGATVVMIPVGGSERDEARSFTDETGRFDIVHDVFPDTCGVPAGRYRIVVSAFRMPSDGSGRPVRVVPEKFGDPRTSGLELDIGSTSTGENMTIALKSSGTSGTISP